MLRNFQRRKCCKEITKNSQNIVRAHRKVLISVMLAVVGQPSWIGARSEIFKNTLSQGVCFKLSLSLTVVSSTCKISWRKILQKPRNAQITQCGQVQIKNKNLRYISNNDEVMRLNQSSFPKKQHFWQSLQLWSKKYIIRQLRCENVNYNENGLFWCLNIWLI